MKKSSGELWVATKAGGLKNVRAVKRIPVEERWGKDCVNWVRNTFWNKYKGDPEEDGDIPEGKGVDVDQGEENRQEEQEHN